MTLRPASLRQLLSAADWCRTPDETRNWAGDVFGPRISGDDLARYWETSVEGDCSREALALRDNNGLAKGYAELGSINLTHGSARLQKFIVGPPGERRRGHGALFLDLLCHRAANELGVHRLDLLVIERNEAAIRLYASHGFVREGTLRDARRYDGAYHNMLLMAKLLDASPTEPTPDTGHAR